MVSLPTIGQHVITAVTQENGDRWKISVANANWPLATETLGFSITGEYVDLDFNDGNLNYLPIVAHSGNSLTIESNENLASYLGRTLIGVHVFDSLHLGNNVRFDIGQDLLEIKDISSSTLGQYVQVAAANSNDEVSSWLAQGNAINYPEVITTDGPLTISSHGHETLVARHYIVNGDLTLQSYAQLNLFVEDKLTVNGNMIVETGASLDGTLENLKFEVTGDLIVRSSNFTTISKPLHQLYVGGDIIFDNLNASLVIENIGQVDGNLMVNQVSNFNLPGMDIGGDLEVASSITFNPILKSDYGFNIVNNLTVKEGASIKADTQGKQDFAFRFNVGNYVTIENNASIDVSNSSYYTDDKYAGCFTGRRYTANCHYGYYKNATQLGRRGFSSAGGAIALTAKHIDLNGSLLANGQMSRNYRGDGSSGGSIQLVSETLSGAGYISAYSAGTWSNYDFGSGGRVALFTNKEGFTGNIIINTPNYANEKGASGTYYHAENVESDGVLTLDSRESNHYRYRMGQTIIRGVGKHQIECVESLGNNLWRLDTDCSADNETEHWIDSSIDEKRSLVGRLVDPDISNDFDQTAKIISNDANSLVVETTQDLSNAAGATMQGVHVLKGLKILNSAYADFGNNRVEVSDIESCEFTTDITILLGGANQELVELLNNSGANIVWH